MALGKIPMNRPLMGAVLLALCAPSLAAPLTVPFDFSKSAIGLDVMVGKTPLYVLVDTGVDPSVIDLKRAQSLGLKIDHGAGGQASGEGDASDATAFPATIEGLTISGQSFPAMDAVAVDMRALSARYGRPLDGILGYSFLAGRIVLIDYPKKTFAVLDKPSDALDAVKTCRKHVAMPLKFSPDENIPIIADFHFGGAAGAISLDTGSSGGITLFQKALELPGLKEALIEKGEVKFTGARGDGSAKSYVLKAPVGFGPFTLPPGQIVSLRGAPPDGRVANIGNKLFAAMKLKMLLDYRAKLMTFYGDCR
jgi:hypothetical protein